MNKRTVMEGELGASESSNTSGYKERAVSLLRGAMPSANVFEASVERIRRSIRLGLFRPNEQLPPERELAELMGVSRTTVRSAIQVLVAGGFLRVKRGRSGGTFVSNTPPCWPSETDDTNEDRSHVITELLDRRMVIESGAAELAAERLDDKTLSALRELVGRMAEQANDIAAFRELDAQFHIALAEATQSQWLIRSVAEVQSEIGELIAFIPPSAEALVHSNMQHARIVAALAKGEPASARVAMQEHISGTTQFLKALLPDD